MIPLFVNKEAKLRMNKEFGGFIHLHLGSQSMNKFWEAVYVKKE